MIAFVSLVGCFWRERRCSPAAKVCYAEFCRSGAPETEETLVSEVEWG